MEQDIKSILYSQEDLNTCVKSLAARISADYQGKDILLVGVLKGANIFMCDLMREINLPLEIDFIAASSYGSSTKSSGVVKI